MNHKEILKPKKSNVILFAILSLVFVPFIKLVERVCAMAPCNQPGMQSVLTQLLNGAGINVERYLSDIREVNFVSLIVGLVVTYIAASYILHFYRKFRHK